MQGSGTAAWRVGCVSCVVFNVLQEQLELPEVPSEPLPEEIAGMLSFRFCAILGDPLLTVSASDKPLFAEPLP